MSDLSTPREHEQYRAALDKTPEGRTKHEQRLLDWMEGRTPAGWPPRHYHGTALGDR